jgi:hypothetical protein
MGVFPHSLSDRDLFKNQSLVLSSCARQMIYSGLAHSSSKTSLNMNESFTDVVASQNSKNSEY